MIIAHNRDEGDRRILGAHARQERVKVCETHDDAVDAACEGAARLCIVDLNAWPRGATRELAGRLRRAHEATPLLLRFDCTNEVLDELPMLALIGGVEFSYRGHDQLDDALHGPHPGERVNALVAILRRVGQRVPAAVRRRVTGLAVLGARRVTAERAAAALGTTLGPMRERFEGQGVCAPGVILADTLCATVMRRMEVGLDLTAAATLAGYSNRKPLEGFFERHLGVTPIQALAKGGFERTLEQVDAWVRPR